MLAMEQRPEFVQRETGGTLVQGGLSEPEKENVSAGQPPSSHQVRTSDFFWVVGILSILWGPWIFFGVLWARNGIQMSNHLAKVVTDHSRITNYVVTLLGTIIRLIVCVLFSHAVLRFAQEWMEERPHRDSVTIFHVSLVSAFKNQNPWPWGTPWGLGLEGLKYLFASKRWIRVVLVVACFSAFLTIPSSTTSLISPFPFDKTARLSGTELDLSSYASDCLAWLNANPIPNNCDWETFNGLNYTTCLGQNQMVDVLESGRGNVLSLLSNNTESLDFSQLGTADGLQFLGPIRGVLPIGLNGVPAFNTLIRSPLSDPQNAGMLSYNYTLDLQGLSSNVSCMYDLQSPIEIYPVPGESDPWVVQNNGTCNGTGVGDVLTNVTTLISMNSRNLLTFWACQYGEPEPSYLIYLRGLINYEQAIGNITCTISPIQPAIFPVTYRSSPGAFSSTNATELSPPTFSGLMNQSVVALSGLVSEAQNGQSNLVAESVITFGVKSFRLPAYEQDPKYLELYEAMIQGIMEYEATYIRLLYSAMPDRPPSCNRTVSGTVSYSVLGWSARPEHIGILMPMTVVNLVSLVLIVWAVFKAKPDSSEDDLTGARSLVLAEHTAVGGERTGLADRVRYHPDPRKVPANKGKGR